MLLQALRTIAARADDAPEAIVSKAQWLEQRGQRDQAKELLQRAAKSRPEVELYALARANVYLAETNPFWALKVLGEFMDQKPPACASRAMAARIHLQEANLEQAERLLEERDCERIAEMSFRFSLLRVELAELKGDRIRVRKLIDAADSNRGRFIEDDQRYSRLMARYAPDHQPTLTWRLGLASGWSSLGLGTVPLDLPTPRERSGSALLSVDLEARWLLARWSSWRILAGGEFYATQYLATPTKELSTRQPILQLGALIGSGPRKLYLGYAADWVNLDGGSEYEYGSFAYSEGHRFEYRFDLGNSLFTYGSLGRRRFWESARTRIEGTHGISKSIAISETLKLTLGSAWYVHEAKARGYDQIGATVSGNLAIAMPHGFALHEDLRLSRSVFPNSDGYFAEPTGENRRDTQANVTVNLTTPEISGLRLGVTYALVHRDSSASAFDFSDHRGVLSVTWQSDSDRVRVHRISQDGRIPMFYPDDAADPRTRSKAEIVEVIQKDETQRRNTSCMK